MMRESDQLATSFMTFFASYCYVTKLFGLKNAGTTFQHCTLRCFDSLISEVVEAYVDDIVVKS